MNCKKCSGISHNVTDTFRDRFSLNSFKPMYAFRKVSWNYPVASIKTPQLFDQLALEIPAAHFWGADCWICKTRLVPPCPSTVGLVEVVNEGSWPAAAQPAVGLQEGCAVPRSPPHAGWQTASPNTAVGAWVEKKKTSINVRDQQLANLYVRKQISTSFDCSSSQQRLLTLADTYSRHTACNSLGSAK